MPHNLDLIMTVAGGLTAACVFGFFTQRLGLSPIVGYLIGGVAVGPFTPGFVADHSIAEQLAELGVILLMFGVGLHLHLHELLAVRRVAIPGAVVQSAVATALGALVAHAFGWGWTAGVVFGLAIAVASTVVLTRVLEDNGALHTRTGHIAIGWLVVEDLFTVLVLVLVPVVADGSAGGVGAIASAISVAMLKVLVLVLFTVVIGARALPVLLGYVAKTRSRELFTLTVLVIALGIAVGAAKLFGTSMALGAFLAGMVVGRSDLSSRAASEVLPLRDAFAVLFFVSVGMLFDPIALWESPGLTLATLGVVIIGKPLTAFLVVIVLRYPVKTALAVAVALGQIGEFSFIVGAVGRQYGILPESASQALVAASIVSITLNPLLYRLIDPLERRLHLRTAHSLDDQRLIASDAIEADRAIVVGYGPIGRVLTRVLREHGLAPVVVELNHETAARLRRDGIAAVYGDASQREILERAGIHVARSILFTADSSSTDAAVRAAKALNPSIFVMARGAFASQLPTLERAGATVAFSSEIEVALSMTSRLMQHLDASPEQHDAERERARTELSG